jgi:hypothetical protein
MKDDNQPKYMWSVSIDEHEGRWIKLYISRDTSSVSHVPSSIFYTAGS